MKTRRITLLTVLSLCAILLAMFVITASAEEDVKFTLVPEDVTELVGVEATISWQTNVAVKHFNVMLFNTEKGAWEKIAEVPYSTEGNSYGITRDAKVNLNVKIQAIDNNNEIAAQTSSFGVFFTDDYKISYDLSPAQGVMKPGFAKGKFMLPYCGVEAPEGYCFVGWQIGNNTYSAYADISVTENIVVKAIWKPVVELPVVINGSSLVGKKSPELAKLELVDTDQYYFCDGYDCANCKYGGTGAMWGPCQASNEWYDAETDEKVITFEDGKTYYYRVAIHAKESNGYVLPEISSIPENGYIKIEGVDWVSVNDYVHGQEEYDRKQYAVHFTMVYNSETGIGGLSGEPVDEIVLDGSTLTGIKEPKPLQIDETDMYYACSPECDCVYKSELAIGEVLEYGWMEFGEDGKAAKEFVDGEMYILMLILHLKDGYSLPTPLSSDFLKVNGINWITSQLIPLGSKSIAGMFLIEYDASTGIEGDGTHVCKPTLVEEKAPACEVDGKIEYYSCYCGKAYRDAEGTEIIDDLASYGVIPATGHNYSPATCVSPATCTNEGCGQTIGDALSGGDHNPGEPATCTTPQFCLDCGVPLAGALGHDLSEASCTAAAVCQRSECGATVGSPLAHSYSPATCTSPKTCTVCSSTLGTPLAHSYGENWESDENGHFKKCSCGAKSESLTHIFANGNNSCYFCGFEREVEPDGLSAGAIVAIVLGSVAGVGGGGFCLWWFVIRKKMMA
ncbi:MAG: hypothetical protein IJY69_00010 [Clostridia bacterium]|nr:hypothetical protein [Clostridia bacterium]